MEREEGELLYEGLPEVDLGTEICRLREQEQVLLEQIKKLQNDIQKLCDEVTKLHNDRASLTRNISELFNTAKLEIARKDRRIAQLQQELDDVVFRRKRTRDEPEKDTDNKRIKHNRSGSYRKHEHRSRSPYSGKSNREDLRKRHKSSVHSAKSNDGRREIKKEPSHSDEKYQSKDSREKNINNEKFKNDRDAKKSVFVERKLKCDVKHENDTPTENPACAVKTEDIVLDDVKLTGNKMNIQDGQILKCCNKNVCAKGEFSCSDFTSDTTQSDMKREIDIVMQVDKGSLSCDDSPGICTVEIKNENVDRLLKGNIVSYSDSNIVTGDVEMKKEVVCDSVNDVTLLCSVTDVARPQLQDQEKMEPVVADEGIQNLKSSNGSTMTKVQFKEKCVSETTDDKNSTLLNSCIANVPMNKVIPVTKRKRCVIVVKK